MLIPFDIPLICVMVSVLKESSYLNMHLNYA